MLLKNGAKFAVHCLLLVAVTPSLLLNIGPNRGLLIHDHDSDDAHVHVIQASTDADVHDDHEELHALNEKDTHTDILILGSDLARPRHTAAADAPALIATLPISVILITPVMLPTAQHSSARFGAGPPNISLASQTCVQILI